MRGRYAFARCAVSPGLLLACAAALAQPLPLPAAEKRAPIPFKQEEPSMGQLAFRSLGGVLLAGAAAYGIVLGLKRVGSGASSVLKARAIRPTATVRLSKASTLHVVEYHGEELLLADGAQGIQLLRSRSLAPARDGKADGQSDA